MDGSLIGHALHVDHEAVADVVLEQPLIGLVDLVHADHLDVRDRCPCSAQKSSISCVSGMPPIAEPPTARFHQMRLKPVKPGIGVSAPTITIRPERPSSCR